MKKSGTHVPRVDLEECGPSIDLTVRRFQGAPEDLMKEAMRSAPAAKKKEKNVSFDTVQGKVGRIYMPRQEVDTIALNKFKGGKRKAKPAAEGDGADAGKQQEAPQAKQPKKKQRRAAADEDE